MSQELWRKVLDVNLGGPFRLTAVIGERMAAGAGGSLINVSSVASRYPTSDVIPYAAAKAWDSDQFARDARSFALGRGAQPEEIVGTMLYIVDVGPRQRGDQFIRTEHLASARRSLAAQPSLRSTERSR
ncbi:MAG: hypothetical protein QOF76_4458 [Solirubrobacteraceae bacterium]|nr:hypothetical protein [Solirubrobacteraceae bacterium]